MSDDQKQNQLFESVSALVDNQASPLELQRILALSEKSNGVRTRWHRYHLARAILRGEANGLMTTDISDCVRAAIADLDIKIDGNGDETASPTASSNIQNKPAKNYSAWYAPFGRVAIAASVALAVVIGLQQMPQPATTDMNLANGEFSNASSDYQIADINSSANLNRLTVQNVSSDSFSRPTDSDRPQAVYDFEAQRLQQMEEERVRHAINRLMLEHAQQSSLDQSVGLTPFIRVSDSAFNVKAAQ